MQQVAITNFSKGMNNNLVPGKLPFDAARLIVNARVTAGDLSPIHEVENIGIKDLESDFEHYGWVNRSVAKWFDNYYWSINDAESAPFYGGNEYPLGIKPPTLDFNVIPSGIKDVTKNGTFKYCITYENSDSWESAPKEYPNSIRYIPISLQEVAATVEIGIPSETDIAKVNVYRTVEGGSIFHLIKSLTPAECGITFIDTLPDYILLFAKTLETYGMEQPPEGGKYLMERDGYFYLAVGDKLYASKNGNPHYWNMINWIGFDDPITGLSAEYQGILVFTANRVYRVGGGDITNAYKQEVPVAQGCINWRTISSMGNAPIWVSNDGICIWDGQNVQIPSLNIYKFDYSNVDFAFTSNDRYNLFLGNGRCVVFDMRSGSIFYERDLDFKYGWYDANVDKSYLCQLDYDTSIDESGSGFETVKYLSPVLPGDELILRNYFRMLIDADGSAEITLYDEYDNELAILTSNAIGRSEVLFPSGINIRGLTLRVESKVNIRSIIVEYEDIGL